MGGNAAARALPAAAVPACKQSSIHLGAVSSGSLQKGKSECKACKVLLSALLLLRGRSGTPRQLFSQLPRLSPECRHALACRPASKLRERKGSHLRGPCNGMPRSLRWAAPQCALLLHGPCPFLCLCPCRGPFPCLGPCLCPCPWALAAWPSVSGHLQAKGWMRLPDGEHIHLCSL